MDASAISRAPAPSPTATPRVEPAAAPTDLAPAKTVEPAVEVDFTPADTLRGRAGLERVFAQAAPRTERGYVADPDSDALVYRVSQEATGEVVFQLPSEQVLKVRAYAREQSRDGEQAADLKV